MLTGGRPLSRASLPLDKAGCFHGHITNILSPLLLRTIDLDAVRIEWETQIQRFLSFGIPLEHLNSHQHVHLLPGLWKQAISLGRQYKIPHLRTGYQSISQAVFTGSVFKIMFQFIAWLRFCAVQERRYTLGVLCSCNFSLVKIKSALETMVRKGNLIELMVHPGVTTKELLQCFGSWNAQWDQERKELSNLRNFLEKMS